MGNTSSRYISLLNSWIFTFLYLSLLHHFVIHLLADSVPSHTFDNIALDCGSLEDTKEISGRIWKADKNQNFSSLRHNPESVISPAAQPPKQVDPSPYGTARLSRSPFTYTFSVPTGPKFIRLYFYPTFYNGFSNFNTYFSVQAGRYTLLRNFSAALHAQALHLEGFYREFCLHVEDGEKLSLTFIPSRDMRDAYAFINGIEIVSMPTNLYYSDESDQGLNFIGQLSPQKIQKNDALALMYRINVGGRFVSPLQDTGMFRSWDDSDEDYLTINELSVLPFNLSTTLALKIPNYSAPEMVYQTARSMGMNGTMNQQYNLTWEFQVDSSFTYFVRLHFCELERAVTEQGDRRFQIYINSQLAEHLADVIYWSGGFAVPVYRNYLVLLGASGNAKVQNLSIALHALPPPQTDSSDAILNGIEIFKLSNPDNNLAGPNPNISLVIPPTAATPSSNSTESKKNNRATLLIGAIVGGAASGFVVLSILFFLIFQRRKRSKGKHSGFSDGDSWLGKFSVPSTKSTKNQGSTLPSDLCRRFSLAEIKDATNNFDSVFIIGVGGFGNVYKGIINDGAISVAIKRLNPGSEQGANEFKTEIEMLSQLRYIYLVSLIGYCCEDGEMILVYDYIARGTLRDHLYKTNNPPLPWIQRLEICIGAARGLQYLHSGAKNTIIHRDVKTTNILLDEKWVAKVSDFGLSKIGPNSMSKPHISTVVKGSFGYLDPEYYRLQRLTEKSDVYSFGVVLCEVLSATPPVSKSSFNKPVSLAEWARQCYRNGTLNDIVDPYLKGKVAPDCLKKFFELAVSCLLDNGTDRPSMSDVVWGLEFALQLQETAVEQGILQSETDINDDKSPLMKAASADDSSDNMFSSGTALVIGSRLSGMTLTSSSDDQSFLSNSSDQKAMSGAVFSQIMNAKGR